jgi:hypothetical protein
MKDTRGAGAVWDLYLLPDRAQTYFVHRRRREQ